MTESPSSESERPQKVRRVARACLQCRARKQRCLPLPETEHLQAPCKRCRHLAIPCSFETERPSTIDVTQSPSQLAQLVVELHHRINVQENRILQLEKSQPDRRKTNSDRETTETGEKQTCSPNPTQSPGSTVNGIDLGPPIATIRSLRALAKDQPMPHNASSDERISHTAAFDIVSNGIISASDCQQAIDLFFDHCHISAPVLDESIRHSWQDTQMHSRTLVLAICSIGTRFSTEAKNTRSTDNSQTKGLTALLDKSVAQLLLRPTSADVTLDSIRVLLLYAQWMPYNQDDERLVDFESTTSRPPRSRYNEISAWAVLGLAMRYALLLGLDRSAIKPFQNTHHEASEEDMSRLRVWYNLLTCNFNLMLTSGLPASIDPRLSASVTQKFGSSSIARYPADLRVTALVELVSIVHETMQSCGDVCGRQLPPTYLSKVNTDMETWESRWLARLRTSASQSQHNQMPFNSVRSYRLSLNSACCAPLLSALQQPTTQSLDGSLYEPLRVCLTAASQSVLALSIFGADFVWDLDSQNPNTFPKGPFHADPDAIGHLYYTVDSTWISLTFSITFLVLCYARGIVDENLLIYNSSSNQSLEPPCLSRSSSSVLSRLLILSLDIFDGVSSVAAFHLSNDFQGVVQYAASLVLAPEDEQHPNQEMNDSAIQSLLDLMNDSGVDWAGNIFGEGNMADWDFHQFAGA